MQKKYLSGFLAGAIGLLAADSALAQFKVVNSNNTRRPYIYRQITDTTYQYFYVENLAADNHSTVVTERVSTQRTVEAQIGLIHHRLADRGMSGGSAGSNSANLFSVSGGNAGGMDGANALWANGNWTHIKDDTAGGKWNANLYSFALGFDHRFNQRILAGIAVHYQYKRGDTDFNRGTIRDHGYGVTPYLAIKATDWLDFDFMAGYSRFTKKRTRTAFSTLLDAGGNVLSAPGTKVNGSPKSDRYFGALFANLTHRVQKWDFLGRLGYLYARDNQKAFTESNTEAYNKLETKLSRLSLRLQAGYKINEMVSPYLFGLYTRDFTQSKNGLQGTFDNQGRGAYNDAGGAVVNNPTTPLTVANPEDGISKNTWGAGLGLRFNTGKRLSGGLEYQYTQNKKVKTNSVNLNVKYKF